MTRAWSLMVCVLGSAASAQSFDQEQSLSDLLHARSYGMGGAFRALGLGTEAVDGNPASMAVLRQGVSEVSGAYDPQTRYGFATAGAMDSTTPVAGGVTYHFASLGRGVDRILANLTTVALDYPLSPGLHLGASGRWIQTSGALKSNAITMDAGLLARLGQSFTATVSGHNLIDIRNPLMQRYYGAALGYSAGVATLGVDAQADWGLMPKGTFKLEAGGEYILSDAFPVRAGYTFDSLTHGNYLGLGLGYMFQGGGLDLAYRHEFGGAQSRLLSLTFRYLMPTGG